MKYFTKLTIGDPVKVKLLGDRWHKGAAESLSSMCGIVRNVKPYEGTDECMILVELESQPKPWHSHQLPSRNWWFKESELRT